jgi:hypothetical protein
MIEKIALFAVCVFLLPTIIKGFRCVLGCVYSLLNFIFALFIPIHPCECGEREILVKNYNGEYSLMCQNCYKQTRWHKTLSSAKSEWSQIRRKKCS